MSRTISSAFVFASLIGAAAAADLPPPMDVAPPPVLMAPAPLAFSWSGFYFGGHGGWGFGQPPFVDGAVAGGQIGVNWQFDAFVLGAEADGSWVDWTAIDAVGSARLRGGLASDRFLVYATGGAAFREFDDIGWVVGGGLEYAIGQNWTVGAEYLYYEFDSGGGGAADVFRGRANYRFPAFASAQSVMISPTSAAFNWSGFYFGGHGGYSFVSGPDITDGYEVGGQIGVNRQFGATVLGIEMDMGYVDWGPVTTAGSVRLRGGYAVGNFLPYVAGGLGIEDSIGWTVGGGVDYALTDRWSIGAEYLHHDFQGGHKADLVRGRVNYLFNTAGI